MGNPIQHSSDNADPKGTAGVLGTSIIFNGVLGYTTAEGHAGVAGACDEGLGNGLYGRSKNRVGVVALSENYEAIHAESRSAEAAAVVVHNSNAKSFGTALYAKKNGSNGSAAIFDGTVNIVAGDLNVNNGKITINGYSVWEFISDLQREVEILKQKTAQLQVAVFNAQQTASDAWRKANS